jgi:hypothetical protein
VEEDTAVAVPGAPTDSYQPSPSEHFDLGLLALLGAVLLLIVASNLWLRRRAQREREEREGAGGPGS